MLIWNSGRWLCYCRGIIRYHRCRVPFMESSCFRELRIWFLGRGGLLCWCVLRKWLSVKSGRGLFDLGYKMSCIRAFLKPVDVVLYQSCYLFLNRVSSGNMLHLFILLALNYLLHQHFNHSNELNKITFAWVQCRCFHSLPFRRRLGFSDPFFLSGWPRKVVEILIQ